MTLVPLSDFAGAMPDPNLSGAMKGNLLAAINQASGGIRFGDTVTISRRGGDALGKRRAGAGGRGEILRRPGAVEPAAE